MEKLKISTLEGPCFSGKTTLLNELRTKFGVATIEEYVHYAGGSKKMPQFPPKTLDEAKTSVRFLVEIEKKRTNDAVELSLKKGVPVIMDRSPLSCIVFEKALSKFDPEIPSVYAYSIEAFHQEIENGNIVIPGAMIYLESGSVEQFVNRVLKRGRIKINMLNDPQALLIMQEWYRDIIKDIYNDNNGIVLKSVDGELDLTAFYAMEFIQKAKYSVNISALFKKLNGSI
jgi:deoxyadenosine/deoxycytidine kinase